ncbi:MAG: protein-L-isoaspartate O-methyltransferase, partial [Desulfobulbaceae bacterium]|nr:protein-L-isoaspartate O-methyltransferase [Desulfobulbaceae bacterium]
MLSASHANLVSRMLRDIDTGYHQTCGLTGRGNLPENIRQAFTDVKRHEFVPSELRSYAYENHPLPIGHGQTISQPFIVALMTDLLDLKNTDRVLEVGCGCGYQAAILSLLVAEVYSTEIIPT